MRILSTFILLVIFLMPMKAQETTTENEGNIIEMDELMFLTRVFNYTDENATEWKYIGDKPCIIDFYATWCAPCRMISPILKDIAKEYKDQIYVFKVDVDKQKKLAGALGIQSMPTVFFIPKDDKPQVIVGAADKATFHRAVKEVLLKK